MRETCRRLLAEGNVKVVIGYGKRGPVFVTGPEDVAQLVWNDHCLANLTVYLKRKEIRGAGPAGDRGERVRRARFGGARKGIAD